METITAILTYYRRPYTLKRQLAALHAQTVPPQSIWLFAQEPSEEIVARISHLNLDRVIICDPNSYFHLRFACALTAQTDFVCLLDDDALPGNRWFENCLDTLSHREGILGTHGTVLCSVDRYHHKTCFGWRSPSTEIHEVDYVGQVWFLRPAWIRHLFAEPLTTGNNGEDIELAARAARIAGIRSYCPPHPPDDTSLWGDRDECDFGNDAAATFRRPGFAEERLRIIQAEVAAGWQPACLRNADSGAANGHSQTAIKKF